MSAREVTLFIGHLQPGDVILQDHGQDLALRTVRVRREVPEIEPGSVGTATVRGVEGVRVVRTDRSPENDLTGVWFTPLEEQIGGWWHPESEVTSFVPDPDTAALRAEVERLRVLGDAVSKAKQDGRTVVGGGTGILFDGVQIIAADAFAKLMGERVREHDRAAAAEAVVQAVWEQIGYPDPDRRPYTQTLSEAVASALGTADEQVAEVQAAVEAPVDRYWQTVKPGERVLPGGAPLHLRLDRAPEGTVVSDGSDIDTWTRVSGTWNFVRGGQYTSAGLAEHYAPLTVVSVGGQS